MYPPPTFPPHPPLPPPLLVRPPAIKWNVTKADNKFLITWIPPDILDLSNWKFTITYRECNKTKVRDAAV